MGFDHPGAVAYRGAGHDPQHRRRGDHEPVHHLLGISIVSQVEERTGVYRVRLEQFEGPLDLLLHAIERSKLDIHQIRVSQITGEYLEYMRQIDRVEVEAGEPFF